MFRIRRVSKKHTTISSKEQENNTVTQERNYSPTQSLMTINSPSIPAPNSLPKNSIPMKTVDLARLKRSRTRGNLGFHPA